MRTIASLKLTKHRQGSYSLGSFSIVSDDGWWTVVNTATTERAQFVTLAWAREQLSTLLAASAELEADLPLSWLDSAACWDFCAGKPARTGTEPAEDLLAAFPETPAHASLTARMARKWLAEDSEPAAPVDASGWHYTDSSDPADWPEPDADEQAEADEVTRYELAAADRRELLAALRNLTGPEFARWEASRKAGANSDPWVVCKRCGHPVGTWDHLHACGSQPKPAEPCDACGKPASPLRYGPTCAACVAVEEGGLNCD